MTMTIKQMYKECEKLFCKVNWDDQESVKKYQEAVKRLEEMRKEQGRRG